MSNTSRRMAWPFPTAEEDPWYDTFESFVAALDASGFAHREDRSLIIGGGGNVSWSLVSANFQWTDTIFIASPIGGFLIQIGADTANMPNDGDLLYLTLTRQPLENITATTAVAPRLPSNDNTLVLAVRVGDRIYLRTGVSLGNGDTVSGFAPGPGGAAAITLETQEEGGTIHADTRVLNFVGTGATAASGGPNQTDVTIPGLEVEKDGGAIESPVTKIDFRGNVTVIKPAPGEVRVTVGTYSLEVEDEGSSIDTDVVNIDFVGGGVTATQTSPGHVEVNVPAGGADRHTAKYVVGNAPNGDTTAECHYLDIGDGVQLAAALAASGAGADVYVRPGVYDYAVGPHPAAIVIPAGVKLRGAGRGHVIVKTNTSGDQGGFNLSQGSELEDLTVHVGFPTGPGSGAGGVVELNGSYAEVRRVDVEWPGVYTPIEVGFMALYASFLIGFTEDRTKIIDCRTGMAFAIPKFSTLGGAGSFGAGILSGPPTVGCDLVRFLCIGADYSVFMSKLARVTECELYDPALRGIYIASSAADGSQAINNHIEMDGSAPGAGIHVDQADRCDVTGNWIRSLVAGGPGSYGVYLQDAQHCMVTRNRGPSNWQDGVHIDALSGDNVVVSNQLADGINNLGPANEVAHNV